MPEEHSTCTHDDYEVLAGQVEALTLILASILREMKSGEVGPQAAQNALSAAQAGVRHLHGPGFIRPAAEAQMADLERISDLPVEACPYTEAVADDLDEARSA